MGLSYTAAALADARFQNIPIPRREILAALVDDRDPREAAQLRECAARLVAIYHFEFHAELEGLKRGYAPFNPDLERRTPIDGSAGAAAPSFTERLRSVLERGNYERLTDDDVAHSFASRSLFPIKVIVDTAVYEDFVIYARGESLRTSEVPRWYGLSRKTIEVPTFDRVCVYIRFKTAAQLELPDTKLAKQPFSPGTSVLKLFRNIPKADLEMLFPNCRLTMRPIDKLLFGVPALLGGVPVLVKLVPAAFALGIVLGLRSGGIDEQAIVTGITGLAVLGGYLFRQWSKFKNRRVKFVKVLSENLYFRNLDSNEGVLTRLIDEAEEEEGKEALLAYVLAQRARDGLTVGELDAQVEDWLAEKFELQTNFEIGDALVKLETLGLIERKDDRIVAGPPAETLLQLETRWNALVPADTLAPAHVSIPRNDRLGDIARQAQLGL